MNIQKAVGINAASKISKESERFASVLSTVFLDTSSIDSFELIDRSFKEKLSDLKSEVLQTINVVSIIKFLDIDGGFFTKSTREEIVELLNKTINSLDCAKQYVDKAAATSNMDEKYRNYIIAISMLNKGIANISAVQGAKWDYIHKWWGNTESEHRPQTKEDNEAFANFEKLLENIDQNTLFFNHSDKNEKVLGIWDLRKWFCKQLFVKPEKDCKECSSEAFN